MYKQTHPQQHHVPAQQKAPLSFPPPIKEKTKLHP